jgi:hypothetical protein
MIHFKIVKDMYTCIIESHMNYNMHILYTLNMLKCILSRYKISLLGYSRLLIKKK